MLGRDRLRGSRMVGQPHAGMFALLEHDPRAGTGRGVVHWDFLVTLSGQALLATWRLAANPLDAEGEIDAERIADHPPRFLDYEGPLRTAPGRVRRLDRGAAEIERVETGGVVMRLSGGRLCGRYELVERGTGAVFRRAEAGEGGSEAGRD